MTWDSSWSSGEYSDGETGKVHRVRMKYKRDGDGNITDILVGKPSNVKVHDHYGIRPSEPCDFSRVRVRWE